MQPKHYAIGSVLILAAICIVLALPGGGSGAASAPDYAGYVADLAEVAVLLQPPADIDQEFADWQRADLLFPAGYIAIDKWRAGVVKAQGRLSAMSAPDPAARAAINEAHRAAFALAAVLKNREGPAAITASFAALTAIMVAEFDRVSALR